MKPRLLFTSGARIGTTCDLLFGLTSLGRDRTNQICLADPAVSRKHCSIAADSRQCEITDLDSRAGTFLNGLPIRRKLLGHGDIIRIGSSELIFLTHDLHIPDSSQPLGDDALTQVVPPSDAPAARNFNLGIEVGHMARDLSALFRISNVINTVRNTERLQQELLRLIFEVVTADDGAVVLLAGREPQAMATCSWSRSQGAQAKTGVRHEIVQRVFWERTPIFLAAAPEADELQNVLCLPLIAVERTLGVLYLASYPPAPPFREEEVYFLESVARIAAIALENVLALDALRGENLRLKNELDSPGILVGDSRPIHQMQRFIARVAQSDSTVLIRGESGTGKEIVARSIHQKSARNARPFIAINCAAIPETLLESELFGHEKGAFTGAIGMRKGKLEAAEDGTLFLDEIGELAPSMQAKLLRVLQQREFERVGGTHTVAFKARVLAATNKNLEEATKSGEFRQDFYYRLNVVSVTVPPLREHSEDIPLLAIYFASKYAQKNNKPFKGISLEGRSLLTGYSWPGNVRELENAIEHAIVLGLTDEILPEDLPSGILEEQSARLEGVRYHDVLNQSKKELILSALRDSKGSYPKAARTLGIHPKYLHRLAKNLNLKTSPPDR